MLGFGSVCARIGGLLAPLLVSLLKGSLMYVFGVLSVISGLTCFLLRETKGEAMPDTLEQEQ